MKFAANHQASHRGFTLIELLVVIGIIAILATIAVPVGNSVLKKARKLQASTAMKGLEIAINGYRTEYNRLPLASGNDTDEEYTTDSDGMALLDVLMAKDNTNNPRQIRFYEPPTAKGNMNGFVTGAGLLDPWGNPYHVELDYDGDGQIANPYAGMDNQPANITSSVIAYSFGSNGVQDIEKGTDDVLSWN